MTPAEDARADCDLRHDVRQALLRCWEATAPARRWQLVAVARSLAVIEHVLCGRRDSRTMMDVDKALR